MLLLPSKTSRFLFIMRHLRPGLSNNSKKNWTTMRSCWSGRAGENPEEGGRRSAGNLALVERTGRPGKMCRAPVRRRGRRRETRDAHIPHRRIVPPIFEEVNVGMSRGIAARGRRGSDRSAASPHDTPWGSGVGPTARVSRTCAAREPGPRRRPPVFRPRPAGRTPARRRTRASRRLPWVSLRSCERDPRWAAEGTGLGPSSVRAVGSWPGRSRGWSNLGSWDWLDPRGERAGASLWHVRPELAAMDEGLERIGDLTLVLVERVEHFAQLVAPAVDLVAKVQAGAGEHGQRQDLHFFVHGELLLAFGPSVTPSAAHSTTHGAAGRARRTPRGATRAGPPGRVARSPASWQRIGQTPGGGRVHARGGASGRGSDGTRGRPLCRCPGGRTGHTKGSSDRSRSRPGRA